MSDQVSARHTGLPEGFVYVHGLVPDLSADLKYCGSDNFLSQPVDGYEALRVIASRPAGEALRRVQEELALFDLGLHIFDAYRPQRAVDHFIRWARDEADTSTQQAFYPGRHKQQLFDEGYISKRSSHTRGSTFDLTIVTRTDGTTLDMGTKFDFFGPESWPRWPGATQAQKNHRLLLRGVMGKHGFEPHDYEWWHFTLVDEAFPDTYFDFPVG
jgi:D-alanyl-D-alanine dipeptidase